MPQQNRFAEVIVAGKGTRANIIKNGTYAMAQGELAIATDVNRMYIGDSNYRFQDLLNFTMPHALVFEGDVVTNNGEVVWLV